MVVLEDGTPLPHPPIIVKCDLSSGRRNSHVFFQMRLRRLLATPVGRWLVCDSLGRDLTNTTRAACVRGDCRTHS